jgi:hypothetical protein
MKAYQKIDIFGACNESAFAPLVAQRVNVPCAHCGATTVIAVPTSYIDYEEVANEYRKMAMRMESQMSQAVRDIELIHGNDNPVVKYYANQWAMLVLEIEQTFGKRHSGTSNKNENNAGEEWK